MGELKSNLDLDPFRNLLVSQRLLSPAELFVHRPLLRHGELPILDLLLLLDGDLGGVVLVAELVLPPLLFKSAAFLLECALVVHFVAVGPRVSRLQLEQLVRQPGVQLKANFELF